MFLGTRNKKPTDVSPPTLWVLYHTVAVYLVRFVADRLPVFSFLAVLGAFRIRFTSFPPPSPTSLDSPPAMLSKHVFTERERGILRIPEGRRHLLPIFCPSSFFPTFWKRNEIDVGMCAPGPILTVATATEMYLLHLRLQVAVQGAADSL